MHCQRSPTDFTNRDLNVEVPNPKYIPGYTGYVPQEKYRPAHTYGQTSHRILLDPCIAMSPRSILSENRADCTKNCCGCGQDAILSAQMDLACSRGNNFGRQQLRPSMMPAYNGFVPRYQNILGHTFSPECNRALGPFEQDQWRDRNKLFTKELEALDDWKICYKPKPWDNKEQFPTPNPDVQAYRTLPATCPTRGCGCAEGRSVVESMMKPSDLTKNIGCGDNSPAVSLMNPGYSVCDFAQRRMWGVAQEAGMDSTCGKIIPKINAFKFSHPQSRIQELYRHCEGMVPNYEGHVPGAQFRIGVTFGTATRNPKRHMQPTLHKPLCYPLKN